MIELVYMSQAQHVFNETELAELLDISRINNTGRGITGMLLYDGVGTFIQAIEGEQAQIDQLYKIISLDPRHSAIQQLAYSEVFERSFPDWKMGYKCFTDEDTHKLQGYSTFMSEGHSHSDASTLSLGLDMLKHFRQTTNQKN